MRARIAHLVNRNTVVEETVFVPVVKDGEAKISDPEQIPETYCDIAAKDTGERYLGLRTGTVYVKVNPWELDG